MDTFGSSEAGRFSAGSVKSVTQPGDAIGAGERMRKGKKALLIAAAMILTIATLAVLNFVRSKMEADEDSGKTAAALIAANVVRAA